MRRVFALTLAAILASPILAGAGPALAWGAAGHRMVGQAAARALPPETPGFLRTEAAALELGELSREPDRSKGSGRIHDSDRDPGHFLDLDDEGRVLGGPAFPPLALTRADYESGLRAAGLDQWKAGYLPYSIVDRWQQLATDFAYWRVLKAAEANPKWRAHRDWFRQDRQRRERLIFRTLGELSHFVADASQPMHVSVHHNGWGDYPNPKGYSTARLHVPFEGDFVQANVRPTAVAARLAPLRRCGCSVDLRATEYLLASHRQLVPLYELERAGGLAPGDPRGTAFAAERLAAGASELRDLIVEAWEASAARSVGWRPVAVRDVLAGKVDPFPNLYGVD